MSSCFTSSSGLDFDNILICVNDDRLILICNISVSQNCCSTLLQILKDNEFIAILQVTSIEFKDYIHCSIRFRRCKCSSCCYRRAIHNQFSSIFTIHIYMNRTCKNIILIWLQVRVCNSICQVDCLHICIFINQDFFATCIGVNSSCFHCSVIECDSLCLIIDVRMNRNFFFTEVAGFEYNHCLALQRLTLNLECHGHRSVCSLRSKCLTDGFYSFDCVSGCLIH